MASSFGQKHESPALGQALGREFYEGRWAAPDFSSGSPRNWLVKKERFFLVRLRGKKGRVLDLGCGGGWKLFIRGGDVVGVDISQASLKAASQVYPHAALANLAHLPFSDETFDIVLSSDVLGHVPLDLKDLVLKEIYRILKKGGRTIHYIEAEGDDPLTKYAKKFPPLYQRHIIETEGHEGLESFPIIKARFRGVGFKPIKEAAAYKMLMYVGRVPLLYDNEYAKNSRSVAALVALCNFLTRFRLLELAANVAITLAMEVTDRLLPSHWASGAMVEYEK